MPESMRVIGVRSAVLAAAVAGVVIGACATHAGAAALGRGSGGWRASGLAAQGQPMTIRTQSDSGRLGVLSQRMGRDAAPRFSHARRIGSASARDGRHASRLPPTDTTKPPKPPKPPGKDGETRPRPPKPYPRPPIVIGIPPLDPGGPRGPVAPPPSLGSGPSGPATPSGGAPAGPRFNGGPVAFAPAVNDPRFVPNEVLVSFPASIAPQAIVVFAQSQRLALLGIHHLTLINSAIYRFRITDGRAVPAVVRSLGSDRRVAAVQPNYVYALQSGAAVGAGDPAQYALEKLKVREAHGRATGRNVLVAVIDSGIDTSHAELKDSVVGAFDSARSTAPLDPHGTAMASAIAAHGRLLGIAPTARLLSVRAFDGSSGTAQSTTTRILEGLQWAADAGARVVNMSFTGPADPRLHQMIASARARGVVVVAAAGNEGPRAPAAFPAAYPEVIAVTATDQADGLFARAVRGPHVAIAAPGVDVFVAMPDGGYTLTSGTSVAAAHVSGLAALLIERHPAITPEALRTLLQSSARDLGPQGRDDLFGAGLADAQRALDLLSPNMAREPLGH